ncbi:hypothetical protein EYF80_018992 [Liparis tanakae]|uniref:Uncharacterized protein n=1 Tax=Liparis tanakae TaxID=230148 RepID=A0A4Z2HXZ1_9TELE|nr:hypothetical protein EYF80_018992 [Liparis tanakae]
MDMYHPVVLFKFSTKRGASPLLSASRRGRSGYCWRRVKKKPGGQRGIKPVRHSVSPRDPDRKDGRKEAASDRSVRSPPLSLFSPAHRRTGTVRRGSLGGLWHGENAPSLTFIMLALAKRHIQNVGGLRSTKEARRAL